MTSNPPDQFTTTVSRNESEALLRRIIHEELTRPLEAQRLSLLEGQSREGPDDPDSDAALLADMLAQIEREAVTPAPRIDWAAVKAKLAHVEAAGKSPD
ncbi:MAG: hypothetical protein J7463_10780 [Roseiflexus sp.]|jgi:hypothetical protein|nr:hypothetical protein [Roseiflexus sp.]MBO9334324.1 hypothetical protein [Roseiflexus sp.]MBO9341639.1 hypothetical protein [Roseiflexus sp.]MBO9364531.1 hypothetical protein [Roseiflexus sp.]MBO9382392.1 hypothetical protein [Roseiflexus sp.]